MPKYLIIPQRDKLDESLKLAAAYGLGFEFNDFFHPDVLDNDSLCQDIVSAYQRIILPELLTSHGDFFDVLIFSYDRKIREISEERIRRSIEVTASLGVKTFIFHSNLNPQLTAEVYRKNFQEKNVAFWSGLATEYPECNFYIENMFDSDAEPLALLAEQLRHIPNFGIALDYAHACIYSPEPEKFIKTLAPYIRHVHINDNDGKEELHHPVGDGCLDWEKFLVLQKVYFPNATVLVENTGVEAQRKSLDYMKKRGFFE